MARLVLGAVGAFAGSFVGQPGLGFMIGSSIGGMIDPEVISQEGPRLNDLKVQYSAPGGMIPIVYGSMRCAGNVIWSTDLQETKTVTSNDGKGGPTVETTTYSYSVDLAVSLCEGEIAGIRKIWANGNLIFNIGDSATAGTLMASAENAGVALRIGSELTGQPLLGSSFAVYTGSETQLPDPTIEADKGVGNVPAYRGQAYVVLNDFQLADYGNRVPNLEFEVIKTGAYAYSLKDTLSVASNATALAAGSYWTAAAHYEGESVWRYQGNWNNAYARPFTLKVMQQLLDGTVIPDVTLSVVGSGPATLGRLTGDLNACLLFQNSTIYLIGLERDRMLGTVSSVNKAFTPLVTLGAGTGIKGAVSVAGNCFIAAGSTDGSPIYKWSYESGGWDNGTNGPSGTISGVAGKFYRGLWIDGNTLYAAAIKGVVTWIEIYDIPTFTMTSTFSTGLTSNCYGISVNGGRIYLLSGSTVYDVTATGNTSIASVSVADAFIDSVDFSVTDNLILISTGVTGSGDVTRVYGIGLAPTDTSLDAIVADQCVKSGLTASDINVAALTDSVHGYAITRQGAARQNLQQLQKVFYFDAAEIDDQIKFVKRGGASAVSITLDDLAAHEAGQDVPEALSIRRVQEVDLPACVTVNFVNQEGDYQVGSESSRRLITASSQQVAETVAIAMTATKAAQVADVLMYDAHAGRTSYAFETTRKFAKYSAADIMTVASPSASYRVRIVKKDESGPLIKWEAVADDVNVYTSLATGATVQAAQTQVDTPGPTRAVFMDIPLIRDADDDAGFYVAMAGYRDAWGGATLFRSTDAVSYAPQDSVINPATIGDCNTTLGAWNGGNVFDETNTLTVTLTYGELVSHTRLEVLNGANAMLVGSEIIQFRDALLVGTRQYRLSGLLRGRRGTEQHTGTHAANEVCVLLTVAGTVRPNEGASAIGALRYYKPTAIGSRIAQAATTNFTNAAVGLKPYAPVHLRGGKQANGDFIINWTRRTRIDGGWRDYVDSALGESSESYSVDIMSGATVKRTLTSSTPTVTYTAAMQTTDFGGAQSTLTVNVYQVSSTVGRGFAANKTY